MDTLVSPTAVTPGIVSDSRGYDGPMWSSGAPADVALATVGATERNAFGVNHNINAIVGTNVVRDTIERGNNYSNLQAELKALNAGYWNTFQAIHDLKERVSVQEVSSLRDKLNDSKYDGINAKIELLTALVSKVASA